METNKKSKKKKKNGRDTDLIGDIMEKKIVDAEIYLRETDSRKMRLRKKIGKIYGKNSRPAKRILKKLRIDTSKLKREIAEKHDDKIGHIKNKYEGAKNAPELPTDLARYKDLDIFSEIQSDELDDKKQDLEDTEVEITVVGTTIDKDEHSFLKLPPKYSVLKTLNIEDFETAYEVCAAKVRYDRRKEEEEKCDEEVEISEEEKEKLEEIEAMSRVVYDPLSLNVNLANKRVTDLKENCKVYLPKPLSSEEEAQLAIRKGRYMTIFAQCLAAL